MRIRKNVEGFEETECTGEEEQCDREQDFILEGISWVDLKNSMEER